MPIPKYSVLKFLPTSNPPHNGGSPHIEIAGEVGGKEYRAIVNTLSTATKNPGLRFTVSQSSADEIQQELQSRGVLDKLSALDPGLYPVESADGGIAFDYVRMFSDTVLAQLKVVPEVHIARFEGVEEVYDAVSALVTKAILNNTSLGSTHYAYAFGSALPEGIHDVHMNQGNYSSRNPYDDHTRDNGVWQDGALLFQKVDPADPTKTIEWAVVLLSFDVQSMDTEDDGFPKDDRPRRQ